MPQSYQNFDYREQKIL